MSKHKKLIKFIFTISFIVSYNFSFSQINIYDLTSTLRNKKIEKVINESDFKTIEYEGNTYQCQRTSYKQRNKLTKDLDILNLIEKVENKLEEMYKTVMGKTFFRGKPDIEYYLNLINKKDNLIPIDNYKKEVSLYLRYYQNQQNNPDYLYTIAQNYLKNKKDSKAIATLRKALSIDPKHSKSKELAIKLELEEMKLYLKNLENEYTEWDEGKETYKALRYLSNAFLYGVDTIETKGYLQRINAAAYLKIEDLKKRIKVSDDYASFRNITIFNLYKMSDKHQEETNNKIDSLILLIKKEVDNERKLPLFDSLIDISYYYFTNDKFNKLSVQHFKKERALLNIEMGNTSLGCEQLYDADVSNFFMSYYHTGSCKSWYAKKSVEMNDKYMAEEKQKAKKWYSDNPNMIKLSSLIGKNFSIVEAYLGKPLSENYRIDAGFGNYGQQFIGNKYKNQDGFYEIGFRNGIVTMVQFYPKKYINYSPEKFNSETSIFDLEGSMEGVCIGETKNNHVGDVKMFTIEQDCTNRLVQTVFYGRNGKLLSVLTY